MVVRNLFRYINHLITETDVDETADDVSDLPNSASSPNKNITFCQRNNKSESSFQKFCEINRRKFLIRTQTLTSIHSAQLSMACCEFSQPQCQFQNHLPVVYVRLSNKCHQILIKSTIDVLGSDEKLMENCSSFDEKKYNKKHEAHQFEQNKSSETSLEMMKIIVNIPKRKKSKIKIAVVEDIFTKELLNCYSMEKSKNVAILTKKIFSDISVIYHINKIIKVRFQVGELFTKFFFTSIQPWYTDGDIPFANIQKKIKNKAFKFLMTNSSCQLHYTETIFFQSNKNRLSTNQLSKSKLKPQNLITFDSIITPKNLLSDFNKILYENLPQNVKSVHQNDEENISKIKTLKGKSLSKENSIPNINISFFDDNESHDKITSNINTSWSSFVHRKTMNSRHLSKLSHPFALNQRSKSFYEESEKKPLGKEKKSLQKRHNLPLIEKCSNKTKSKHLHKALTYSLPESIYLKYQNDTLQIQNLITNQLFQIAKASFKHTEYNLSEIDNKTHESNTYNEWLLQNFPLGLSKTTNNTAKRFNYKFSFYIPENENCHNLFLEFYNIKSKIMTRSQFQQWCLEKSQYNTIELYDDMSKLFSNFIPINEMGFDQHVLKFIASRSNCLVVISDRFTYGDFGQWRAIQFVGQTKKSVMTCIRYFLKKK